MNAAVSPATGGEVDELLGVLRRNVAAVAGGPHPPARVRMEAAGVSLEVEWRYAAGPVTAPPVLTVVPDPVEPDPCEAPDTPSSTGTEHAITAGNVGVFHRTPEPGAALFVVEGDTVVVGQQVGIIEAMKMMIPVRADRAGRIERVLCETGVSVQFGTPLMLLDAPAGR